MKKDIQALFFDVHGVLYDLDFITVYRAFAEKLDIDPEFIIDLHDKHMEDMLVGNMGTEKIYVEMGNNSVSSNKVSKIWKETVIELTELNKLLIGQIKKWQNDYTLSVLSDASGHRIASDKTLGIYNDFDFVFLSYDVGLKKPDVSFYQHAIEKAGVDPEVSVFIDDREENARAAEKNRHARHHL